MMRFAALDDKGNIQSIIFAQDLDNLVCNVPEGCHAFPCDDLRVVAGLWRRAGDAFEPRPQDDLPEELYPVPPMTPVEFWRLFQQAERIAIRASTDPQVVDMREMLAISDRVDRQDSETITNVKHLEEIGLLAAGRAAEVLAG